MKSKIIDNNHKSYPYFFRPLMLIIFIIGIISFSYVFEIGEHLGNLQPWIQSWGIWAPLVYLVLYIVIVVASIPATPFGIIAGIMFGSIIGILLIISGATIGSAVTFLIARYFAREAIVKWMEKSVKFQRLDQLIETHGSIIIIMTRLVPLFPFNLLNYAFGLTKISFSTYILWSTIGMIPGTVVFVGGSDALYRGFTTGEIPWALTVIIVSMILLLVGVGWYVKKIYTKK